MPSSTPTGVVSFCPVLDTVPPPVTVDVFLAALNPELELAPPPEQLDEPKAALLPELLVLPPPETEDVAVMAVPGTKVLRRI